MSICKNQISSVNQTVLHDGSIDDDDDDDPDSEFEPCDYSHDKVKPDVEQPTYIRTCLANLIATDNIAQLESSLQMLPSLIQLYKIECEEIAEEFVRILLNYNSTFNIENFEELQLKDLITLCKTYPLSTSDYLCKQFYEKNYTIKQRSLILKTIEGTAKELSQIDQIQTKIDDQVFVSSDEDEDENDLCSSIIQKRLKLKTKYRMKHRSKKRILLKTNHFGNIVGHFFYPLIAFIDKPTSHLSLINGDNVHSLLCELLSCLARLCIYAQNTLSQNQMIKQLLQLLKSLEKHEDPGVRHTVVYAYACCLVSFGERNYDEDLQMNFIQLKQRLDFLIIKDSNTEVQKLARLVRQILLKTLKEKTENLDCLGTF